MNPVAIIFIWVAVVLIMFRLSLIGVRWITNYKSRRSSRTYSARRRLASKNSFDETVPSLPRLDEGPVIGGGRLPQGVAAIGDGNSVVVERVVYGQRRAKYPPTQGPQVCMEDADL